MCSTGAVSVSGVPWIGCEIRGSPPLAASARGQSGTVRDGDSPQVPDGHDALRTNVFQMTPLAARARSQPGRSRPTPSGRATVIDSEVCASQIDGVSLPARCVGVGRKPPAANAAPQPENGSASNGNRGRCRVVAEHRVAVGCTGIRRTGPDRGDRPGTSLEADEKYLILRQFRSNTLAVRRRWPREGTSGPLNDKLDRPAHPRAYTQVLILPKDTYGWTQTSALQFLLWQ